MTLNQLFENRLADNQFSRWLDSPQVKRFDDEADRALAPLRDNPALLKATYTLSEAANHSMLWMAINWLQVASNPSKDRATRALATNAVIGLESLLLNQGIKRLFNRQRPDEPEERPHKLRKPQTSSFPSGHAASAACALFLLGSRKNAWILGPVALLVALSRAVVRIHHFSDVLGGFAFGAAFGLIFRRILRRR